MSAAFARAAATLDGFLAQIARSAGGAEGFSVKIGLIDTPGAPGYAVVRPGAPGAIEWFWAGQSARRRRCLFRASLANDAERVHGVSLGQTIRFTREDFGDWMYLAGRQNRRNATACPALAHATAEQRRQMKEQYGLDCD